jgi:hypothetical protein
METGFEAKSGIRPWRPAGYVMTGVCGLALLAGSVLHGAQAAYQSHPTLSIAVDGTSDSVDLILKKGSGPDSATVMQGAAGQTAHQIRVAIEMFQHYQKKYIELCKRFEEEDRKNTKLTREAVERRRATKAAQANAEAAQAALDGIGLENASAEAVQNVVDLNTAYHNAKFSSDSATTHLDASDRRWVKLLRQKDALLEQVMRGPDEWRRTLSGSSSEIVAALEETSIAVQALQDGLALHDKIEEVAVQPDPALGAGGVADIVVEYEVVEEGTGKKKYPGLPIEDAIKIYCDRWEEMDRETTRLIVEVVKIRRLAKQRAQEYKAAIEVVKANGSDANINAAFNILVEQIDYDAKAQMLTAELDEAEREQRRRKEAKDWFKSVFPPPDDEKPIPEPDTAKKQDDAIGKLGVAKVAADTQMAITLYATELLRSVPDPVDLRDTAQNEEQIATREEAKKVDSIQEQNILTQGEPAEHGSVRGSVVNVVTKRGGQGERTGSSPTLNNKPTTLVADKPTVQFNIDHINQNIPQSRLGTFDFFGGPGRNFNLGPNDIDGFGGEIKITIPEALIDFGRGNKFWQDFTLGGSKLKGSKTTTFQQPAGTQQIIGPPPGQSGTAFGLNNFTTFNTNVERHFVEVRTGIYKEITGNNRLRLGQSRYYAGGRVALKYGSTDVDTSYTTGNVGGPSFNNFTNFDTNEFIVLPTIVLGFAAPLPDDRFTFTLEGEAGPSLHFTKTKIAACGSTDGTGGSCNGGFFQTNSTANKTFIGGFVGLKAGVEAKLAKNFFMFLQGAIIAETIRNNILTTINTTPPGGAFSTGSVYNQPTGFQFGRRVKFGIRIEF